MLSLHCTLIAAMLACTAPDGSRVDTTGTTTAGLEESLRYACDHSMSHYIEGGGAGAVINLTTSLDFRQLRAADGSHRACPMQGKTILWDWVVLNWPNPISTPGIVFDSFMDLDFRWRGLGVYAGIGCMIKVLPTNPVPIDGYISAVDSHLVFGWLAASSTAGCIYHENAKNGAIVNVRVSWDEMNGAQEGIVFSNAAQHGIIGTRLEGGRVHNFTGTGLRLGANAADGAAIYDTYVNASFYPSAEGATAIELWGGGNEIHAGILLNEMPDYSSNFAALVNHSTASNIIAIRRNDAAH